MSDDLETRVRAALERIADPVSGKDIVAAGLVRALSVADGRASFVIEVAPERAEAAEPLRRAAEEAVRAVEGVAAASAVLTAHARAPEVPNLKGGARQAPQGPQKLPGIDHVIAVASGKGGVGKSTVSANLAVALAAMGKKVGLLDADVYGPSQPRMLGITGKPSSPDGNTIMPLRNYGVTLMSLGLMAPEGQAVVWRGPMLIGALQQMLDKVAWGKLDVLVVDLPPGTGDVQMTLCQKTHVDGAVVVSTPQDIALIDARKGIDMFQKMNTPILGIVENMSAFICDECGKVHHPFGHGGARAEAEKLGVPFLGEIPLDLAIREGGDNGAPVVAARPGSPEAEGFVTLARTLAGGVLA